MNKQERDDLIRQTQWEEQYKNNAQTSVFLKMLGACIMLCGWALMKQASYGEEGAGVVVFGFGLLLILWGVWQKHDVVKPKSLENYDEWNG